MIRVVAGITFQLVRKPVKNINLRVRRDGQVFVLANSLVSAKKIDGFVKDRAKWIQEAVERTKARTPLVSDRSDEECLALFHAVSDSVFPLFAGRLSEKPELCVKLMKSRWGVCYVSQNRIMLNKALAEKPTEAIEYVILHEYVHFFHPNHQAGFHAEMAALMPDYRERRKMLK